MACQPHACCRRTGQEASPMSITLTDPGAPNLEFERPAGRAHLERTAAALASHGFLAQIADSAKEARRLVLEAIPDGAEVHVALSETMRELGITAEIDQSGRYDSVRSRLTALDRATQAREIIVGSGSGSQLGAYAYAAGHGILVIGHQKLVPDLGEGLRRVREYSLPREHARMQSAGRAGSMLTKTLIIHSDPTSRITVILVPETLGF